MHFFLLHFRTSCCFFFEYREPKTGSHVRLCGIKKKCVRGVFNLHELSGKISEALSDQKNVTDINPFRKKALFPVAIVLMDDIGTVAFVNGGISVHYGFRRI